MFAEYHIDKMKITRQIISVLLLSSLSLCVAIAHASAGESQSWRKDKVCGHKLKTENAEMVGCVRAYCVTISEDSRVCACILGTQSDYSATSDDAEISIAKKGNVSHHWRVTIYPPAGGAVLRVDKADLTGSGNDDLLVATMTSESQGIGIQSWQVRAVVADTVSNAVPVEDYGIMGFATRDMRNNHCSLLATQWLNGWEPKRGSGLYLFGRWFDFNPTSAELYPALNRPAIYRRYLYSFEQTRLAAMEKEEPTPVPWFTDKTTAILTGPYPEYKYNGGQQINRGDTE